MAAIHQLSWYCIKIGHGSNSEIQGLRNLGIYPLIP
jgi:hypothetical protein